MDRLQVNILQLKSTIEKRIARWGTLMKFDWIEEGVLAASPLPASDTDIQSLYEGGIRAIVTLTERSLTAQGRISPGVFEKLGLVTLHVPIDDMRAPTNEQAEEVVAFIN